MIIRSKHSIQNQTSNCIMAPTKPSQKEFAGGRVRTTPTSNGAITVTQTHATLHFGGMDMDFELNTNVPGGSGGLFPSTSHRKAVAIHQINGDGVDKLRIQNDNGDYED